MTQLIHSGILVVGEVRSSVLLPEKVGMHLYNYTDTVTSMIYSNVAII